MTGRIIDAGIVAAMMFKEEHALASQRLLAEPGLQAPDLLYAEVGSVIWKRWRRGEIDAGQAQVLMADCLTLALSITPSGQLVALAMELALQSDRTVYDSLYLALAIKLNSVLVTTDKRLVNALSNGPLKKHILWIGDMKFE